MTREEWWRIYRRFYARDRNRLKALHLKYGQSAEIKPSIRARAVELYGSGKNSAQIAEELHVSDSVVRKWVRGSIGMRSRAQTSRRYDDDDEARAVEMYKSGASVREVSERTGVGEGAVRLFVRKAGVQRSRSEAFTAWANSSARASKRGAA